MHTFKSTTFIFNIKFSKSAFIKIFLNFLCMVTKYAEINKVLNPHLKYTTYVNIAYLSSVFYSLWLTLTQARHLTNDIRCLVSVMLGNKSGDIVACLDKRDPANGRVFNPVSWSVAYSEIIHIVNALLEYLDFSVIYALTPSN